MRAIEISRLEVLVLRKLVVINSALGKTIGGMAGREQAKLTEVLAEITIRAETANATEPAHD
jgi:hypothetical protein